MEAVISLWQWAHSRQMTRLTMPGVIWRRLSVFQAVPLGPCRSWSVMLRRPRLLRNRWAVGGPLCIPKERRELRKSQITITRKKVETHTAILSLTLA